MSRASERRAREAEKEKREKRDATEVSQFIATLDLDLDGSIDPFLVLADWLQGRGHPWGELIAVHCAAEVAPKEKAALLWSEQRRLLNLRGASLCFLFGSVGISLSWRRGFISRVVFDNCALAHLFEKKLTRVFTSPACALVTDLGFERTYMTDDHVPVLLAAKERLARMKSLNLSRNRFTAEAVAQLRQAFPRANLDNQRRADLLRTRREPT